MGELREAVSRYILRSRGIQCPADRVVITSGATQGISIISRVLFRPGDQVVVEDPGNANLVKAIGICGYEVMPVMADDQGLITDLLPAGIDPAFIYVTPSHQFPLGGILPASRRLDLVRYAEGKRCYIVEDDYDSEYRYDGFPLNSLYSLAPERTVYVGTFSKALAPGLRLGYMLLPEALVERVHEMKKYTDVHTTTIEQSALTFFLEQGRMDLYLRKMKKLYAERRQVLIGALEEFFPGRHIIHGAATGLHLVAEFPGSVFTEAWTEYCRERGLGIHLLEKHCMVKGEHRDSIIFGYSHLKPEQIRTGIALLADCIRRAE